MNAIRTISIAAAMVAGITAVACLADAQSNQIRRGWASVITMSQLSSSPSTSAPVSISVGSARARAEASDTCGGEARTGNNIYSALVGSWLNTVTITPAGGESRQFTTMETFNVAGTMIDESEGPGNLESIGVGAWAGGRHNSTASFEVFHYDPSGNLVGRVRVRGFFHVNAEDHLVAPKITVDFIDPSGNVFCGVATATITGARTPALTP